MIPVFFYFNFIALLLAASPVKVIVFPLQENTEDETLAWLAEGISISVSEQLRTQGISVMDRNQRTELVERHNLPANAQLSRASMISVAQKSSADWIVTGKIAGAEENLKITIKLLDLKALKLSGDIVANGPLAALQQIENELAWLILTNTGLEKTVSRGRFQERMRKVPNSAYMHYIRSLSTPKPEDQLQLLLKAVELYGDFPEAQFQLGRLHFQNGDCGNAMPHLFLVPSRDGMYLEGDFMRGICSLQNDLPDMAIQSFSHLLSFTCSFEILNNLGAAYLRKGDIAMAMNALRESQKLAPADSTVLLNIAIAQHMQGNDSAALEILEEAVKGHSDDGMLQFLKGCLLKAQGKEAESAAASARARELGTNVETLQAQNPRAWVRPLSAWKRP